jgi:hypothetical protein
MEKSRQLSNWNDDKTMKVVAEMFKKQGPIFWVSLQQNISGANVLSFLNIFAAKIA